MTLVITGATGNLGTALVAALRAAHPDEEIVGVCRRPPARNVGIRWVPVDLSEPDAAQRLAPAFDGARAVIHLAWAIQPTRRPEVMRAVNVGGTEAVLTAAARAEVAHVVHASSLGAYSRGAGSVPESWPTGGIATSAYSQDKVLAERLLDDFAGAHPDVVVTRLRPTLVMQHDAAAEIAAFFLGPLVPTRAIRLLRGRLPVLPLPTGLRVQFVHAEDVAAAVLRILDRRAAGAFNLAADVLGPVELAALFGARPWAVSRGFVRALIAAAYRAHAIATAPGWLDLALDGPLLDAGRARRELGWEPRRTSTEAVEELLEGLAAGARGSTPALRP